MTVEVHYRIDASPHLAPYGGSPGGHADDPPVVVLAGSLGSNLHMWDPQIADLAESHRVIRYDIRGHGESPVGRDRCSIDDLADDLLALLDRLELGRVHLVGLSLGGMTAMRLASLRSDRVQTLSLLCTSARLGPAQAWLERARTVRAEGVDAVADAVVSRWFSPQFIRAEPERIRSYRDMIATTNPDDYAACCEAIAAMDLRADLPRILAPTLVFAGRQDPATPIDHLEAIVAGITDAELVMLDPAAHLASAEQPAAVNHALLQHFSSHSRP